MSHEQSITIQDQKTGRWVNIASVINGKKVSNGQAEDAYYEGRLKPLGDEDFATVDEAEAAAVARSKSFDHKDTNMPQGRPQDYSPDELQYGVSEFARVFGREPATDMEMEYVSKIIAGADAEQLAATMGDPNDGEIAGDPYIGRADQTNKAAQDFVDNYNAPDPAADPRKFDIPSEDAQYSNLNNIGEKAFIENSPYRTGGEIHPRGATFDRMQQGMGTPQDLMQQMQYQGEPDPARMAGAAGGPGGVDQAQALMEMMMAQKPDLSNIPPAANFEQRMGPGSVGVGAGGQSSTQSRRMVDPRLMGRPQSINQPGVDLSRMPPDGGTIGDPAQLLPGQGQPTPDIIQKLLQAIMGGMGKR